MARLQPAAQLRVAIDNIGFTAEFSALPTGVIVVSLLRDNGNTEEALLSVEISDPAAETFRLGVVEESTDLPMLILTQDGAASQLLAFLDEVRAMAAEKAVRDSIIVPDRVLYVPD